jgi:hypothetical protein
MFTAAWLHIPDISFFAVYMICVRYSHGTFFCNVLNALRRLRPITCVFQCLPTPVWLHLPDISTFAVATHSFSHICTLSNTHFCSCFHCHYYEVPFPYIRKLRRTSGFAIGNPGQCRVPRLLLYTRTISLCRIKINTCLNC